MPAAAGQSCHEDMAKSTRARPRGSKSSQKPPDAEPGPASTPADRDAPISSHSKRTRKHKKQASTNTTEMKRKQPPSSPTQRQLSTPGSSGKQAKLSRSSKAASGVCTPVEQHNKSGSDRKRNKRLQTSDAVLPAQRQQELLEDLFNATARLESLSALSGVASPASQGASPAAHLAKQMALALTDPQLNSEAKPILRTMLSNLKKLEAQYRRGHSQVTRDMLLEHYPFLEAAIDRLVRLYSPSHHLCQSTFQQPHVPDDVARTMLARFVSAVQETRLYVGMDHTERSTYPKMFCILQPLLQAGCGSLVLETPPKPATAGLLPTAADLSSEDDEADSDQVAAQELCTPAQLKDELSALLLLFLECNVSGQHASGNVEFVLKSAVTGLLKAIVEVKTEQALSGGIYQLLSQVFLARHSPMR